MCNVDSNDAPKAESSSCGVYAEVERIMVSKNFLASVVGLLAASSNAYKCGRSSFLHRTTSLQSTALAVTDDLASAVVESGKDVKQLKFEPIFKSFAQNEYFVSHRIKLIFVIEVDFVIISQYQRFYWVLMITIPHRCRS
jgi:hypothetical protein